MLIQNRLRPPQFQHCADRARCAIHRFFLAGHLDFRPSAHGTDAKLLFDLFDVSILAAENRDRIVYGIQIEQTLRHLSYPPFCSKLQIILAE